jgi:hypothetical protein
MATPLLDIVAASEARDAAIARVGAASVAFVGAASIVVTDLARSLAEFTTDDVWDALAGCSLEVREPRALGAVMRDMQRLGVIAPTDRYRPSARVACHARPVRVWRSLVR